MDTLTDVASMPIIVEKDEEGKEITCRSELEIASFLALVESKRKKGGGLFKRQAEEITFVSYIGWPFLFMKRPDNDSYVVFDMLGLFSYTINFAIPPDVEGFLEHVKRNDHNSSNDPDSYIAVLKTHKDVFQNFIDKVTHQINGQIEEKELICDIVERISLSSNNGVNKWLYYLPSRINEEQAEDSLNRLIKLKNEAITVHNQLNATSDTLKRISGEWHSNLSNQQLEISNYYNSKINDITPDVQNKVNEYKRRMNMETHSVDMDFSQRISGLQVRLSKWKREEDMYIQMGERHRKKIDYARQQKNTIHTQLSQLQSERDRLITKAQRHYENLIADQWERIRSLERSRDEAIGNLESKKKEISQKTVVIDEKIGILAHKKNEFIEMMEGSGTMVPDTISTQFSDAHFVVHVPLLVAHLHTDKKSQWLVYPPMSFKKNKGFVDTFKGLIGSITLPLEPRTSSFDKILQKKFDESLESDPSIGHELITHCKKYNMLEDEEAKAKFLTGIEIIKDMHWLKDKQFVEIKSGIESAFTT